MSMRDDHIDRAIDEVARELTAGEPDAAFRSRVVARIAVGSRAVTPRRAWWIVAPLAAAAAIAIAVALFAGRARSNVATPTTARHEAPATTEAAAPRGENPATASPARSDAPVSPIVRADASRGRKPDVSYIITTSSEVAALAPPPLAVPSIAIEPIDRGPSIRLQQLAPIERIEVAPLDADDIQRRDP
jgi:hypothetical protein